MTQSVILALRGLIVLLALGGLADALYFTFAYYGRIRKARWVPEILCAREGSSCVTVVQTPYARVFGVPNSLLGIPYYIAVILWAAASPSQMSRGFAETLRWFGNIISFARFADVLIIASAVTVALGVYLVYALRRKLGVDCPLCYTAHAINAVLLVLLILLAR